MANKLLWHKLDDEGASEVGIAPVITNSPLTFVPAVWGLGVDDCGTGAKAMQWNNILGIAGTVTKGEIWFQWKPAYDHTSVGNHSIFYFNGGGQEIECSWFGALGRLLIYYWRGGYFSQYRYNFPFVNGQQYTFAVKWDGTAGANDRFKIYLDKVLKIPASYNFNFPWAGTGPMILFLNVGGKPTSAVQDNVIIWDNPDADLNGIDFEDGLVPVGGGRLIDNKMISPLIDGNLMIN